MGKHRRPRDPRTLRRSLKVTVVAGVAGAVTTAGTLIAMASPSTPPSVPDAVRAGTASASVERMERRALSDRAVARWAARRADREQAERKEAVFDRAALERAALKKARKQAELKRKAAARKQAELKRKAAARKQARLAKAARAAVAARTANRASRSSGRVSAEARNVLAIAAAQQGDRYARGGDGPSAFDCSGFTQFVFAQVGISLPHSSAAQRGVARRISASEVQPGDLVFVYNGGGGSIGHVAIYGGPGVWYEASNPRRPVGKNAAWSSNVSYGRVL